MVMRVHVEARRSVRLLAGSILVGALAGTVLVASLGADRAGAGGADSAAVRGYIVPTANNPDVDPATTCEGSFAANDQSDDQAQSPQGSAENAVTLAGCSYQAPPFDGPSTEDRPVAFAVLSGPGGLLCGAGVQQSQVCALGGINFAQGAEYRVQANNEAGVNQTGTLTVEFCADDPPVGGACGVEDEQRTVYTIDWTKAGGGGGGGGGGGANCAGKPATIVATSATTKGTGGNDVIVGRKGKDKIKAKGGKDRVCSKGGNDKLKGGGGKDFLKAGAGKDALNGGGGKDTCKGGPGKDTLKSCEKS
jgi:hypothetical protein